MTIQLEEGITDTKRQFSDINLKLDGLNSQLPQGAGPITFQSDFGDTAALMLTVASPKADDIEITARANSVESAIRKTRDAKQQTSKRVSQITVVDSFPQSISAREVLDTGYLFQAASARAAGILRDSEIIQGSGFIGVDGVSDADDSTIQAFIRRFIAEQLKRSELHPDAWAPAIIRDPRETRTKLASVAGDKYSYAELDNFSDLIGRTLQGAPEVSKVERRGVLSQTIYLDYSQDRLAAYGLRPADLSKVLSARNIIAPGGTVETGERRVILTPSGQFEYRWKHRGCSCIGYIKGRSGLFAGSGPNQPRLSGSCPVSQLLHLARRKWALAAQPRDHLSNLHARSRSKSRASASPSNSKLSQLRQFFPPT